MAATVLTGPRLATGVVVLVAAAVGLIAGADATLAVAVVLGMVFVALAVSRPTAGMAIFAFLAPIGLLPAVSPAITIAKVSSLLLALSWFAATVGRARSARGFTSAHPAVSYLLLAFLAWTMLSLVWAENHGAVLVALERYAPNLALFAVAFSTVKRRQDVPLLLCSLVAGTVVAAVYGFLVPPPESYVGRLTGPGGDPNDLATVLIVGVFVAAGLTLGLRVRPGTRLALAVGAVVCAIALLLTLSRGGLVGVAFAAVAAVVFAGRKRLLAAVIVGLVVLTAVSYFTYGASQASRDRVTTVNGGSGRTSIWTVAWRMVEDNPVLGVGANNFRDASIHYVLRPGVLERSDLIVDTPKVAHNTYLQVLAELGVVGAALFLGIVGFSIRCLARATWAFRDAGDHFLEVTCRGMMVGLLGMLAADFFIAENYSLVLWLMLALGPALLAVAENRLTVSTASAVRGGRFLTFAPQRGRPAESV